VYSNDKSHKYRFYDTFTTGITGLAIIGGVSGDLSKGVWGKADFVILKSAKVDSGLRMALVHHKKWKKYMILCKGTELGVNSQTLTAIIGCPNYPKALAMA